MPQTIDNMIATWNNAGTTFTFLKANITDTASAAGSLLMDLQVGGSSKFAFRKDGLLTVNYPTSGTAIRVVGNGQGLIASSTGSDATGFSGYGIRLQSGNSIEWASSTNGPSGGSIILSRKGDANLRLGAADAAAPVAQTLSVQSVVAGTTNTAGANLTITGSQGTGTGAGGSIVFQVAPAGSSGTAQNALSEILKLDPANGVIIPPDVRIGSQSNSAILCASNNSVRLLYLSTNMAAIGYFGGMMVGASQGYTWGNLNTAGSADLILARDDANKLALRNGANAQAFNVYNTYTDASNYERAVVRWSSNDLQIGVDVAGTGATNRQLHLVGGTSGQIRFYVGATLGWYVSSSGHFLAGTDNTYDIGASGANRPRDLYLAGKAVTSSVQAAVANGSIVFRSSGGGGVAVVDTNGAFDVCYATALPAGGTTGRGIRFSSNTTNFGVFFGSGAPTLSAAKGSLYLRSDGSTTNDRMYVNTDGATTWTAVTTAA